MTKTSKVRSHKYKPGRRILGWRVWVIIGTILAIWVLSHYGNMDNTYVAEPNVFMNPVVVDHPEDESVETKIRKYFPRSHKTMIAVAYAESGMNMNAVGYNCYYNGASKACKPEDRHKAWSRDCGILQINTTAKSCPKETVDEHLKRAADLSRVQGLNAWVTYWNGDYKKYLAYETN